MIIVLVTSMAMTTVNTNVVIVLQNAQGLTDVTTPTATCKTRQYTAESKDGAVATIQTR